MKGIYYMIKQIFLDTETTGTEERECGVWQIGGIIRCGKRTEEFLFECDIFEEDTFDPKATEITGITIEKLETLPDPKDIYQKFTELLGKYVDKFDKTDKFIAINYGAEFDARVLRAWFEKNDDDFFGSWFFHPWVCMMNAVAFRYQNERPDFKNFKLETVLDMLHIRVRDEKLHNALTDAKMAMAIYDKLMK